MPTVLALISVVGGIVVFCPSGLIPGAVMFNITTTLLDIRPQPPMRTALPSDDQDAIDRFVNEGGPPASKFCNNTRTVET